MERTEYWPDMMIHDMTCLPSVTFIKFYTVKHADFKFWKKTALVLDLYLHLADRLD